MSPRPTVDGYGPDDWERLNGSQRKGDERSPFALDYDRLIYQPAFRRLQGKTQVVSPGEADFFRTRLTHTLEVAQVARRLAEHINRLATKARLTAHTPLYIEDPEQVRRLPAEQQMVDPDLCEAASVLHDLGHPPFGHAGEAALSQAITAAGETWGLAQTGAFDANAQSFRLAVKVLPHKERGRGLELTRAVLDGSLKYPWICGTGAAPDPKKWSVNPTEEEDLKWVRIGVPKTMTYERSLEAQIIDWADDVAYAVHDLDDWFRAGYMPLARLATQKHDLDELSRWITDKWISKNKITADERNVVDGTIRNLFQDREQAFHEFERLANAREPVFDPASDAARRAFRLTRSVLFDNFTTAVWIQRREGASSNTPRRFAFEFCVEDAARQRNEILKELLWRYVVGDPRMATMQHGQQNVAHELFAVHEAAARENRFDLFPGEFRQDLEKAEGLERLRIVADFVSGMTDSYARRRWERLQTGGEQLNDYA
ncbi:MAG: deoxyguanosinetriphosphate triphosphohydrolase family protein [Solirubrobacteraceae bacterium]